MKLIEDTGLREANDGRIYRYGLFECPICGKLVEKILKDGHKAQHCSHECYAKNRIKRGPYKSRIVNGKYIYIYNPRHPHAIGTKKLYVAEHRLIMERAIGRYLSENEIVHHINGNTMDNGIENLQLMTASGHVVYHKKNAKRTKDGKFAI